MVVKANGQPSGLREASEVLLGRAVFLPASDRALLEQVYDRGVKPRQIAAVTGESTRAVQRRVRILVRRLCDPQVVAVLRHHRQWDRTTARVAIAYWVHRRTLHETAHDLKLTLHQVRQQLQLVRGLLIAADAGQ